MMLHVSRPATDRGDRTLPLVLSAIMACCWLGTSQAADAIKPERVEAIAAMLGEAPCGFGAPITDRAAWKRLAARPEFKDVVPSAEKLAKTPIPPQRDEDYLDFSKTGNRTRGQAVQNARISRVATLALAECLEDKNRFVTPLVESIADVCRERTWVMPAHDRSLENFNGKAMEPDLRATAVAWELAHVDYILGRDKLPDATRKMIRDEVRRRVTGPFLEMVEGKRRPVHWLRATHNWNAVCLAGTVGAALALEDSRDTRAWYAAAGEAYIRNFLKGFTEDGYCSEGMGYWNYGYGHFVLLGEITRQATGGKLDLLADLAAIPPGLFAIRAHVMNGIYPTIADSHPGSRPEAHLAGYLSQRFGREFPATTGGDRLPGEFTDVLMYYFLPAPLPKVDTSRFQDSPLRTWFDKGGVLICRPAPGRTNGMAVVLKGGHNAEHHNHNDVGSFSVVLGSQVVLCDPGAEVYTARTFSSRRYDSKVLSSYGHAVPVVAGKFQSTGLAAKAVPVKTDFTEGADTITFDLRSGYAVPELEKLERTFVYQRGGRGSLEVVDEVGFKGGQTFETALVTWGKVKQVSSTELVITEKDQSLRVQIDAQGIPTAIKTEVLDEDVSNRRKPTRIGIALKSPVSKATVKFHIAPAP